VKPTDPKQRFEALVMETKVSMHQNQVAGVTPANMAQSALTREPNESVRQTVRELFYAKPIIERGRPLFQEMKGSVL
jgi:hypothetical protein